MSGMDEALLGFLRDRLADDLRVARAAQGSDDQWWWSTPESPAEEHVAHWSPARAIAEVEKNLRILDWAVQAIQVTDADRYQLSAEDVLLMLAAPYAGHRDFREEWRISMP